jgi:hypothetical protein
VVSLPLSLPLFRGEFDWSCRDRPCLAAAVLPMAAMAVAAESVSERRDGTRRDSCPLETDSVWLQPQSPSPSPSRRQ